MKVRVWCVIKSKQEAVISQSETGGGIKAHESGLDVKVKTHPLHHHQQTCSTQNRQEGNNSTMPLVIAPTNRNIPCFRFFYLLVICINSVA